MQANMKQSRDGDVKTFILVYKLTPEIECRNFCYKTTQYHSDNFDADFSYGIWQDMLTVYYQCGKRVGDFQLASRRAELLVKMLLSGSALYRPRPIEHALTTWFEYDGKLESRIVVGKIEETHPDSEHADNESFKKSETILLLVSAHSSLRRALDDFHSCIAEISPDLYLFAYRAIEDVRSHFEKTVGKDDRKAAWESMNKSLSYKKEDYDELVTLSEKYRHSNALEEPVDPSVAKRQISFVQDVIIRFIQYLQLSRTT